jgi:two-component system cell cycle sensor histidine kinase PleC
MIRKCREFLAQPRPTKLMPWRIRFLTLDLFFGMAWSFVLSNPIGTDDRASTFMLFLMLLVVAISSMLGSSLPIAVLALTLAQMNHELPTPQRHARFFRGDAK